ncbi:hypothetical protein SAMN02745121_08209 [Nannocystis exedens]|uniref:Uncharacterized protein n=1 Tax=Nannocystis exedens TaxID=54 RepID=A0A1I2HT14_9BACT|nr:hypothetical protein [Nannocystis exedens]PCC73186.1 hypothetical protein NAEX_06274 [Nannocystis exedens]SFF33325.1 hypothetical protein SAMN02745121_08209 [Nannocystis exedens]
MALNTDPIECYGDEAVAAAAIAGDFDLASPAERDAWSYRVWQRVALAVGFERELEAAVVVARGSRVRLAGLHAAALDAFEARARSFEGPPMVAPSRTTLAEVRHAAIYKMVAAGSRRANTWSVEADPTTLSGGACYPHLRIGEPLVMRRAFEVDTGPGYFADASTGPLPATDSACGWIGPMRLNLGTFPWVYGGNLSPSAPGLSWQTAGNHVPAVAAMRAAASMWTPLGNLSQDARVVAAQLGHFRRHTDPLVEDIPVWEVRGRPRPDGVLYRRGGLLYFPQGSLEIVVLLDPRGILGAVAYNYILERFAVFFAMRRAVLRARDVWTPEMERAAANNPDPCLRALPARKETSRAS